MANVLFDATRSALLAAGIDWVADTIRATLVNGYAVDIATHAVIEDVPVGARVATIALTGKAVDRGTASADDALFTGVTAGANADALVIWKDTGLESTSTLVAYIDSAAGIPVESTGADIPVTWDFRGIFRV